MVLVYVELWPYIAFSRGHRSKFICYCLFDMLLIIDKHKISIKHDLKDFHFQSHGTWCALALVQKAFATGATGPTFYPAGT